MSRDLLERQISKPATTRADELVLDWLEAIHQRSRETKWRATTDQIIALREEFAAELRGLRVEGGLITTIA